MGGPRFEPATSRVGIRGGGAIVRYRCSLCCTHKLNSSQRTRRTQNATPLPQSNGIKITRINLVYREILKPTLWHFDTPTPSIQRTETLDNSQIMPVLVSKEFPLLKTVSLHFRSFPPPLRHFSFVFHPIKKKQESPVLMLNLHRTRKT